MSIKFKNILVYIVYFFIIVIGYHIIKNIMNKRKINSQIASESNVVSSQVTYNVPYVLDSYEPRFIAPRYYDTQFLVYEQPVYVRSFGYPVRHRIREHAYRPRVWSSGGGGGRVGYGWRGGSKGKVGGGHR
jgi:hypothetical protein